MNDVVLKYCSEYELSKVKSCLNDCIGKLGGLQQYIGKDDKVLLKINLLMKKRPEEATTTHPVFVQALAEILLEHGAEVLIGDSPGGPFLESMVRSVYKTCGMEDVAKNTEAKLNGNFGSCEKENPKGLMLKKITAADMLNDVDKVISVSKLKTHGMMTFTGAVKNMFGIIPGVLKAEYHLKMPDRDNFADALVDICLCADPVLSFMDGILGMDGEGPSAGNPRPLNIILASDSPYHLDKAACRIISLPFEKVPTIARAAARGLATMDMEDVRLLGDPLDQFIVDDFIIPQTREVNPVGGSRPVLSAFMNRFLKARPVFDHDLCISCGICRDNCPAKVIQMEGGKPALELKGCIRCFCCQELCPKKAVSIYRPFLLRTFLK